MSGTSKKKKSLGYRFKSFPPTHWNRRRLNRILDRLTSSDKKKNVLILGDVGVDRYTLGTVERISPEAPVPIVRVEEEELKLGLAANVADNVRVLGGIPQLVGVIGRDRAGEDFRKILKASRISSSFLVEDQLRRTVLKERVVSERQQLLRIDYESGHSLSQMVEKKLFEKFGELLPDAHAVIIEDYAKGVLTPALLSRVLDLAQRSKKIVALDPNIRTEATSYRGAQIITPNTKEAEALSGIRITDQKALAKAGKAILEQMDCEHVVITRGKEGMALFRKGTSEICLIPTFAKEVYDVSGAGDTVIAVLVLSLLSGADIQEAAVLANLAAGIEVGKRGTATVSTDEIRQFIRSQVGK